MHHNSVDFIYCVLIVSPPPPHTHPTLSVIGSLSLSPAAFLFDTTSWLFQFQSPSGFPSLSWLCDGRSQPRCIWREYRWSRASVSRLWCKHPGSWVEHSPGPRRQYPAVPHYTPEDHQSRPEQAREKSLFLPSFHPMEHIYFPRNCVEIPDKHPCLPPGIQRTPCGQWSCRGRKHRSPCSTEWGRPHTEGKTGWTLTDGSKKERLREIVVSICLRQVGNINIEYQTTVAITNMSTFSSYLVLITGFVCLKEKLLCLDC